MSPLTAAILAGAVVGAGLAVVVVGLLHGQTPLRQALRNLGPASVTEGGYGGGLVVRVGSWGSHHLASRGGLLGAPRRDLSLVGMPVERFYGDKIVRGVAGLAIPSLMTLLAAVAGVPTPVAFPLVASLALGALLFVTPDLDLRRQAARARLEFARGLGAYIELVALERIGGAGAGQALDAAAAVGDNWVFRRLRAELDRARLAGITPWTQLRSVARELRLPELADLADIIRLSGDEGAAVYDTLRARARTLRSGLLQSEQARANATSDRLTFPVTLLAISFLMILLVAQGIRLVQSGP